MTRLRRGQAVAELDGDSCSACRVAASPAVLESARYSDQLAYCENCGRLLWGGVIAHRQPGVHIGLTLCSGIAIILSHFGVEAAPFAGALQAEVPSH